MILRSELDGISTKRARNANRQTRNSSPPLLRRSTRARHTLRPYLLLKLFFLLHNRQPRKHRHLPLHLTQLRLPLLNIALLFPDLSPSAMLKSLRPCPEVGILPSSINESLKLILQCCKLSAVFGQVRDELDTISCEPGPSSCCGSDSVRRQGGEVVFSHLSRTGREADDLVRHDFFGGVSGGYFRYSGWNVFGVFLEIIKETVDISHRQLFSSRGVCFLLHIDSGIFRSWSLLKQRNVKATRGDGE